MVQWRRYAGAQRLQLGWTGSLFVAIGVAAALAPRAWGALGSQPLRLVGVGGLWLVGLLAIGFVERRRWNRMVTASRFDRQGSVHRSDLQTIVRGHTVTVSTDVPSLLAGTHTRVRASVDGVDANFTITIRYEGGDAGDEGLETGNPGIDERFVIEGKPRNVKCLLAPDVQAALMDLTTPGTIRVTGDSVVYDVPYTRFSAAELGACTDAVVELVERLEDVGRA